MKDLLQQYQQQMFKLSSYKLALSTISVDAETIAPKKGAQYRNKSLAFHNSIGNRQKRKMIILFLSHI